MSIASAGNSPVTPESGKVSSTEPSKPESAEARELLELMQKQSDDYSRGLVEIVKQRQPGVIDFFPKIQHAGTPLTAKSRLFRGAVEELLEKGWLFPPEEHAETGTRMYEYRGDTANRRNETVLIAIAADAPAIGDVSTYPTATPVPGRAGYVFSPYDAKGGYVP